MALGYVFVMDIVKHVWYFAQLVAEVVFLFLRRLSILFFNDMYHF